MSARHATIALSLIAFGLTGAVQSPATTGALPTPANKIVGLWETQGTVRGCDTGLPVVQVRNNLLFHAGGTVSENIAPVTSRNMGMGVWSYDAASGSYTMVIRFNRYSSGTLTGFSTVERQLQMSEDGQTISGEVLATHFNLDGTVLQELCGEATSTRLY